MAKLFCFFWEEAPLNQSRPSTTSFLAQGTLVVCEEFSGCGTPDTRLPRNFDWAEQKPLKACTIRNSHPWAPACLPIFRRGGGAQKKERASIVPLLVLAKLLVVSDCFLPQPGKQGLINNDYKNKCTGDLETLYNTHSTDLYHISRKTKDETTFCENQNCMEQNIKRRKSPKRFQCLVVLGG